MKTMSVLEIDLHWAEAKKALMADRGILVTRDGEAVGRLIPMEPEEDTRQCFDPEAHRRWSEEVWGDAERSDSPPALMESREERDLISTTTLKTLSDERPKFDPEKNRNRREKLWGKGGVIDTLTGLLEDREDRKLL
jgi:antitoxin (DNA-binding transcriptional repressor) of toxin-antitoxin stability system